MDQRDTVFEQKKRVPYWSLFGLLEWESSESTIQGRF